MSSHYLNVAPYMFERLTHGEVTAVVTPHTEDFQVGDDLVVVHSLHAERSGDAARRAQADDAQTSTFAISHVGIAQHTPGVTEGRCLLSLQKDRDHLDHILQSLNRPAEVGDPA